MDWPSDVLPTPGGPTKQRIGPFIATGATGAADPDGVSDVSLSSAGDGELPVSEGPRASSRDDEESVSPPGRGTSAGAALRCLSFCTARYSTIRSFTLSRS